MNLVHRILLAAAFASLFACASTPPENPVPSPEPTPPAAAEPAVQEPELQEPEEAPEPELPPAEEVPFDPSTVSKELFDSTKSDVQALIEKLNLIIRAKDYAAWQDYLGPTYRAAISDPAFLARVSESARLKNQKIVLRDLEDYFMHVVVPSRANDRVDDIAFIGQNRVKAFTVTPKGRLRLYDLEKTDRGWKIVN